MTHKVAGITGRAAQAVLVRQELRHMAHAERPVKAADGPQRAGQALALARQGVEQAEQHKGCRGGVAGVPAESCCTLSKSASTHSTAPGV